MYPRVRVKESEDPISRKEAATTYLLRVIESLSLEDNGPAKSAISNHISNGEIDPKKSYTRNSHPNFKNQHTSLASTLKEKCVKCTDQDNISNNRANSISRPRAVLSSPDNDNIIGNQNKRIQEKKRSKKGQASDNSGMTNRHSPLTRKRTNSSTQSSYLKTQGNDVRNDHKAEMQKLFNLRTHTQPITNSSGLKQQQMYRNTHPRASHSDARLHSASNHKSSVFIEVGACNDYPTIKCSYSRHQSQEQRMVEK